MSTLVLVRHGESMYNANNIFTGWTDSPLTENGKEMAKMAGQILKDNDYRFNVAFTSVLSRAQETLLIILNELNLDIPIYSSLYLNERHYGSLEGMNKNEARNIFGSGLVQKWRRGLTDRPPKISLDAYDKQASDIKYKNVSTDLLPYSENLDDVNKRVIKYFKGEIEPYIRKNYDVIISAHQNSIRSIIYYLENTSEDEMLKIETNNCEPIAYTLDENLNILNKHIYTNVKNKK